METYEKKRYKLKYNCFNCNHHWTRQSDDMLMEDSCPICTVLNMQIYSEVNDEKSN